MQIVRMDQNILPCVDLLPPTRPFRPVIFQTREDIKIVKPGRIEVVIAEIPAGFKSDGASVPRAFQPLFPPLGMYLIAALAHDFWCVKANNTQSYDPRDYGDQNFHQWVRWCGVSQARAKPMSAAVISYGNYLHFTGKLK